MLLEAWQNTVKFIHLCDNDFNNDHCTKDEKKFKAFDSNGAQLVISMKGCFILYGYHKSDSVQVIESKQDTDMGILSFQLGGNFKVTEPDYKLYRFFENELHITFYSTKRELKFEVPPVLENFRIYLAPRNFLELLAKFHGRFSVFADRIKRSEPFNLFETPSPITPGMKVIIREILSHKIGDPLLSRVYYETKITELLGCQLEQIHSVSRSEKQLSLSEKSKMEQARQILVNNLANAPSIAKLARLVATNEHKLKSGFRELFGKSIYNYLLHQRIEKSVILMDDDTLSLDQIAGMVGYTESAHFSRAFKKVKGVPPGVFRKKILTS